MNQGKLEVAKQEMARVNMDILGISELKWMGMDKFNSGDHYIYYCGQESLIWNGLALKSIKESKMQYLGTISKTTEGSWFISNGNITVIQVYVPTSNVEEAEVERYYEDLQDFLELTPKNISFIS